MEKLKESQGKEFIREWFHCLCLKGISSINLGHDPGLKGMVAVTRYLEGITTDLPWNDGRWQIYRAFFQPSPIEGLYGRLELFLAQSVNVVGQRFEFGRGTTFDFSVYMHNIFHRCVVPGVSEFAQDLADRFAKAYNGESDLPAPSGELFIIRK